MVMGKKNFEHGCNGSKIAEFDILTDKRNTLMAT
jgi:hypothetical protein